MADPAVQNKEIGEAIGRIPSGVFVITAQSGDRKVGMLASWVQQVGFEPPTVSVGIHPDRELYQLVEETGAFTVNVLSNQTMHLMKNFSRYSPEQFEGMACHAVETGIVLDEAVAVMHCRVKEKVAVADHHLFVAEVVDGRILNGDMEPMVHLRKSGFNY
jgi:flavin reductase (DIM6/NTAB) family NADH-FMN oxidoreductase RutF